MWLDKLKELKKSSKMSSMQIADATGIPESTVKRIFSGDTYAPGIDKLRDIVYAMGGSLDDILDESDFHLPTPLAEALKTENMTLQNAVNDLTSENVRLKDENVRLKDETVFLKAELAELRLKLEHKEEILKLQDEIIRLHKTYAPGPKEWKL